MYIGIPHQNIYYASSSKTQYGVYILSTRRVQEQRERYFSSSPEPLRYSWDIADLKPPSSVPLSVSCAATGTTVCSNGPGHMTKIAGIDIFKHLPLWSRWVD